MHSILFKMEETDIINQIKIDIKNNKYLLDRDLKIHDPERNEELGDYDLNEYNEVE